MALVPAHLAPLVTSVGFYRYWLRLVQAGATHQAAYEATETVHEQILGWRKYTDYKVFERHVYRVKRRQQSPA